MKSLILFTLCVSSICAVPSLGRKPTAVQKFGGGRIVGGQTAADKQFPYEVAVYYDTSEGSFFCGGALIDLHWVLTAGHCTYKATVFTLHLGSNSLVDDDPNRVTLGVSHSITHPNYDPNTLENDIGLIKIETNIALNDYIQLIPMGAFTLESDVSVTVSGWGATGDWDGASNYLNFVQLSTISNDDCKGIYGQTAITDGMVCAIGPTNEGTCNGDSGGPLVTVDAEGKAIHVGLVSFVSTHGCETDHPSGYTRTAAYLDWINSVIA